MRLKTAVLTAVLAGSLAGPSVGGALAANRSHSVTASRAARVSRTRAGVSVAADDSGPGGDPIGVVDSVISEIEFDVSSQNLQAILWDLPGFGPY